MVYTGALRHLPEILRLSDMYDGSGGVEIEVLKDTGAGNLRICCEESSAILGIVKSLKQGHTRKSAGYGPVRYPIYEKLLITQ